MGDGGRHFRVDMNYLPGMAVITLNVIGDAATNVIVNFKEGVLDKDTYNK